MRALKSVNRWNVGRIAERIVANELEAQGFRVSELNKDGIATNADLIAAGHKRVWQIQVKGATNQSKRWWVQYGYCTPEIIRKNSPMFNRRESFYKADIVVLVAVRSPKEYRYVVMPVKEAEHAAQINLNRSYRTLTRDGREKKPSKVWVPIEASPRDKVTKAKAAEWRVLKRALRRGWETLTAGP